MKPFIAALFADKLNNYVGTFIINVLTAFLLTMIPAIVLGLSWIAFVVVATLFQCFFFFLWLTSDAVTISPLKGRPVLCFGTRIGVVAFGGTWRTIPGIITLDASEEIDFEVKNLTVLKVTEIDSGGMEAGFKEINLAYRIPRATAYMFTKAHLAGFVERMENQLRSAGEFAISTGDMSDANGILRAGSDKLAAKIFSNHNLQAVARQYHIAPLGVTCDEPAPIAKEDKDALAGLQRAKLIILANRTKITGMFTLANELMQQCIANGVSIDFKDAMTYVQVALGEIKVTNIGGLSGDGVKPLLRVA